MSRIFTISVVVLALAFACVMICSGVTPRPDYAEPTDELDLEYRAGIEKMYAEEYAARRKGDHVKADAAKSERILLLQKREELIRDRRENPPFWFPPFEKKDWD